MADDARGATRDEADSRREPRQAAGGGSGDGQDPFSRRINPLIAGRPWTIVLAFVLLTVVFAVGAPGAFGDQEAGAGQFEEDVDEFDALEAMEEDFERGSRASGGTSAQLFIEDDRNVLSRGSLLRMLETQDRLENEDRLRVSSTTSPGSLVAQELDPTVETPEDGARVVERASQRELEAAIAAAGDRLPVSEDFSPSSGSATVAQMAITYDTPPKADTDDYADLQFKTVELVDGIDGYDYGDNVVIFADAVFDQEIFQLLGDTAIVVFPAAILLILLFLLIAYRDPIDLGLGLSALVMTLIWTFGFMGYVGIPFSDSLITVFPLLLAVGIDFGIHIINRYREERIDGAEIGPAMLVTGEQLSTAFLIVTITTVFSFAANLTAPLEGLRNFGIVAAFGMVFTFAIFGIFLPAAKVGFDRLREDTWIPQFGRTPLGREGSILGRALTVGTVIARVAPAFVLVTGLVLGAGAAGYGTGVDVEFNQEVFFPDEERIAAYERLPEPFSPGQYNFMRVLSYLEDDFGIPFVETVTVYADDPDVRADYALTDVDRAIANPPDAFQSTERRAEADSVLDSIDTEASRNPEFARTVDRYDTTGDGVPDREVDRVYDELFASPSGSDAQAYVTSDRSSTRIQFQPDVDAEDEEVVAAAQEVADGMRLDAVPTGDYIVFQAVVDRISTSAVNSLLVAFTLTAAFLVLTYWWLEGRAVYGVINLVPVVVTVALLAGSMRLFDVALSPFNAPILGVSIGLGVDYTVHFMHRFVDEFEDGADVHDALLVTVQGTGGALTGSMLTTVSGLGVLYVALIPLIVEYGLLLALGVFYAWATAILLLPSTIVVWDRLERRYGAASRARLRRGWRAVSWQR